MSTIIRISDIISSRVQKEQELERFKQDLEKIQRQIATLEFDLKLTNTIISMIEEERVVDLLDFEDTKRDL